ncbi:MAG: T9SS type A sorting domain-containing protein [Bacteroidota bacterium]
MAQYPLVTIQDVQMIAAQDLANCIDTSSYNNDTVRIHAVVTTNVDSAAFTTATRAQCWLRNGYGDWSGLDVISFDDPSQSGLGNTLPGDSIEITGVITEFGGSETEILHLSGTSITILGAGATINPTVVNVGDLNDNSQTNILDTGEKWEGQYIEVQNVTVVSVDPFSGGTRVSFVVQDGSGNKVNISDKFRAQRLPNGSVPGNFSPPNVGDTYNYIRGVMHHSPNGCTGANGRGYEISPTKVGDYDLASAAPSIIAVNRSQTCPLSNAAITISTDLADPDGIMSANLKYAIGAGTATYTTVAMTMTSGTSTSGTWSADIPGQADGAFVKYYVEATDNNSNTSNNPAVPTGADPLFYTARDNGCSIVDVQFVPTSFSSANSGYNGLDVTVTGVVTASAEATNLGFVFIQQENELAWAGIMVTDNPALATLSIGDQVTVTGTVNESFGFTRIENVSSVQLAGSGTINPVSLDPGIFTTYDHATNEPYEGMLVELANPTPGGCVNVVDANPDGPNSNFAEYRIGTDVFNPTDGSRLIAGRVTNSAFSSLNVSYVNDAMWASQDGIMNVSPVVVMDGDAFGTITGVMAYTFGAFKLVPRNDMDFNFTAGCGLSVQDQLLGSVRTYPNPVSDQLSLVYEFDGVMEDVQATVYDLMGRSLKNVALAQQSGQEVVNVSDLAAGQYILKVTSTEGVVDIVKFNVAR